MKINYDTLSTLRFDYDRGYPSAPLGKWGTEPLSGASLAEVIALYPVVKPLPFVGPWWQTGIEDPDEALTSSEQTIVAVASPYSAVVRQEFQTFYQDHGKWNAQGAPAFELSYNYSGPFKGAQSRTGNYVLSQSVAPDGKAGENLTWSAEMPSPVFRDLAVANRLLAQDSWLNRSISSFLTHLSAIFFVSPNTALTPHQLTTMAMQLYSRTVAAKIDGDTVLIEKITTLHSHDPVRKNGSISMWISTGSTGSYPDGEINTGPLEPGLLLGYKITMASPKQGYSYDLEIRPKQTTMHVRLRGRDDYIRGASYRQPWFSGIQGLFTDLSKQIGANVRV